MASPQPPGTTADPPAIRPITTSGPISKLPCELLTHVISFLPEHVKNLRLVCHGFNDCSWPAFGARLQDSMFDMRSYGSMENLKNISENKDLAPYVTSLCFITGWVSPSFPGPVELVASDLDPNDYDSDDIEFIEEDDYLPSEVFGRLMDYRLSTSYWFTEAWKWTPCTTQAVGTMLERVVNASKQCVVDFLSTMISNFVNLRTVQYKPDQLPHDFRDLHSDILEARADHGDLNGFYSIYGEQRAVNLVGMDILFRAIAAGDIRLKCLSVEVPAMTCHALATYTPAAIVQKAIASVEILRVDTCDMARHGSEHHLVQENEISLTTDCLPNLKLLEWNGWLPFAEENTLDHMPLLPSWMIHKAPTASCPPLRHLSLLSVWTPHIWRERTFDDSFFAFLAKIGQTLKTMTLEIFSRVKWHQLIEFLASSPDVSLDVLEIQLHICAPKNNLDRYFEGQKVPSKEILFQTAQTVTLKPDTFEAWLEKRWNPRPKKRMLTATGAKRGKNRKRRG
ncbi:hypothetical protein K491DRAFT_712446 [Lophiostoma macrostomum CBS 122681]|uniref:F-box domain-containing protein n=1 Tax=Lophiostoma macrostomum CBS 122681 TaxID=1314788 RepID=A0A6A6TI39_9PLEO|nr:hypothetical protein K491DRAFT_712446 [Lophiostoma macrostomum CBS 122681]